MAVGWFEIIGGFTRGLVTVKRSGALKTSDDWNAFWSALDTMGAYVHVNALVRTSNWRDASLIAFLDSPRGSAFHVTVAAAIMASEPSLAPGQAFDIAVIRYAEMPADVRVRAEEIYRLWGQEGIEAVVASLHLANEV